MKKIGFEFVVVLVLVPFAGAGNEMDMDDEETQLRFEMQIMEELLEKSERLWVLGGGMI